VGLFWVCAERSSKGPIATHDGVLRTYTFLDARVSGNDADFLRARILRGEGALGSPRGARIFTSEALEFNSGGIPALFCFDFEDCFAVAKFGPDFIVAAKGVPDKKSRNKNKD
jgi:hypothetical protein